MNPIKCHSCDKIFPKKSDYNSHVRQDSVCNIPESLNLYDNIPASEFHRTILRLYYCLSYVAYKTDAVLFTREWSNKMQLDFMDCTTPKEREERINYTYQMIGNIFIELMENVSRRKLKKIKEKYIDPYNGNITIKNDEKENVENIH